MKVKDLLKQLEGVDPEATISFDMEVGCCGDTWDLELAEEDEELNIYQFPNEPAPSHVNFRFSSMPGYYSCIQMGGTIRNHDDYWKDNKPQYMVNKPKEEKKETKYELHADGVKEID